MPGSGELERAGRIEAALRRLLALIREQTGLERLPLRPGCSPEALDALEAALGMALPEDQRALMRMFNGQMREPELTFPPSGLVFLDDIGVLRLWQDFRRHQDEDRFFDRLADDQRIRWVLYHEGRIPIAYDESGGHYLCLDRIPGPRGSPDQLVVNVDEVECVVLADSVADLFECYVNLVESGRMTVERQPPEYGQGYEFVADGRYVDHDVWRELVGSSDFRR